MQSTHAHGPRGICILNETENKAAELSQCILDLLRFAYLKFEKIKKTFDQDSKNGVFFVCAYDVHKISCASLLRMYTNSLYDIE